MTVQMLFFFLKTPEEKRLFNLSMGWLYRYNILKMLFPSRFHAWENSVGL